MPRRKRKASSATSSDIPSKESKRAPAKSRSPRSSKKPSAVPDPPPPQNAMEVGGTGVGVEKNESMAERVVGATHGPGTSISGPLMEVVIALDTTRSMVIYLDKLRVAVQYLVHRLHASIPGIRIAIIGHGDYCGGGRFLYVAKLLDFGETLSDICNFIRNVNKKPFAVVGGDKRYEIVMKRAREELSWTPGSKRLMIMIGNDEANTEGYDHHIEKPPADWRGECMLLKEMGVTIHGVHVGTNEESIRNFKEMAELTNGVSFQLGHPASIVDFLIMICYRAFGDEELIAKGEKRLQERNAAMGLDNIDMTTHGDTGLPKFTMNTPSAMDLDTFTPGGMSLDKFDLMKSPGGENSLLAAMRSKACTAKTEIGPPQAGIGMRSPGGASSLLAAMRSKACTAETEIGPPQAGIGMGLESLFDRMRSPDCTSSSSELIRPKTCTTETEIGQPQAGIGMGLESLFDRMRSPDGTSSLSELIRPKTYTTETEMQQSYIGSVGLALHNVDLFKTPGGINLEKTDLICQDTSSTTSMVRSTPGKNNTTTEPSETAKDHKTRSKKKQRTGVNKNMGSVNQNKLSKQNVKDTEKIPKNSKAKSCQKKKLAKETVGSGSSKHETGSTKIWPAWDPFVAKNKLPGPTKDLKKIRHASGYRLRMSTKRQQFMKSLYDIRAEEKKNKL